MEQNYVSLKWYQLFWITLYNVESKVHGHVMRHFLALLSMLSDLHTAYHLTNPCTRSIRKERYICNYDLFFKMGPSKFLMSLFSWIWRRLCLFFFFYFLQVKTSSFILGILFGLLVLSPNGNHSNQDVTIIDKIIPIDCLQ